MGNKVGEVTLWEKVEGGKGKGSGRRSRDQRSNKSIQLGVVAWSLEPCEWREETRESKAGQRNH